MTHYKAVYLEFARDPCNKAADKLGKANSVIRDNRLRDLCEEKRKKEF